MDLKRWEHLKRMNGGVQTSEKEDRVMTQSNFMPWVLIVSSAAVPWVDSGAPQKADRSFY